MIQFELCFTIELVSNKAITDQKRVRLTVAKPVPAARAGKGMISEM